MKAYHTHGKDDYGTPTPLYELLDDEFHLTLDVSADAENTKCDQFLTKEMDALSIDWWGRIWCNPPFSLLDKFLVKLIKELLAGHIEIAVALIAARSDTQAMFLASSYAGETRFLKGRVSYLVYPTEWQRSACANIQGVQIDPGAWPLLTKELQLPKTAILALMKDPTIPGGDPLLAQSAPFPSTVLIFDRRPNQITTYWDWKKKVKTAYVFQGKDPKLFPWEKKHPIPGNLLYGAGISVPKGGVFTIGKQADTEVKKGELVYIGDGKPTQEIKATGYENWKSIPVLFEPKYWEKEADPALLPGIKALVNKVEAFEAAKKKAEKIKTVQALIDQGMLAFPGWEDKVLFKPGEHDDLVLSVSDNHSTIMGEHSDPKFDKAVKAMLDWAHSPNAFPTPLGDEPPDPFDTPDEAPPDLTPAEITEILTEALEGTGTPTSKSLKE